MTSTEQEQAQRIVELEAELAKSNATLATATMLIDETNARVNQMGTKLTEYKRRLDEKTIECEFASRKNFDYGIIIYNMERDMRAIKRENDRLRANA